MLHIGTHNINSLVENDTKLSGILDWMLENQVDIMALNKTNLDQKNELYKTPNEYKKKFYIYWSSKQQDKHKGLGVVLICTQKWNKHYQKHKIHSPYLMSVYFLFKNVYFCIWVEYVAPQDKTILHLTLKQLKKEMNEEAIRKKSNNIVHILLEDFNIITNSQVDHTSSQHSLKPKIYDDLEAIRLIDSYRKLNKEKIGNYILQRRS
ncbi:hypothetical protein RclHR1_23340001 [Rhizophagus clarus]|uniref:Endonuclease/exonuclease/phosphatase domain-containing protein n=1 Tax=Rhizophagus clarus TaxID=94130 RepID=A0A2Z6QWF7_9GLOM|nr:hypothetical protein RclHR1_23340001 [Rhizophagus clarus]GES96162.1 hypothetical protein RCL_jg497.t1 [Rhizophagus clarus]